ncbi:FkbM family methyltransferase [uncultured Roseibium sp.]|uniref:FkbM family methyltransferase n=1 Tax=uncultured Roseibium sp. TaxID=1936171 RepID=UPI0026033718|nr:FkbM family methyltransferase [uncultured Roseibium sp.]
MRLFSTGSFEQTQLDGVLDLLDENPPEEDAIFLDVGGNIGVYSILLRDRFKTVFAFEPNPVTYEILKANLGLSGAGNVEAVNMALSDRQGQVPIFIPRNGNLGWATLDASHHEIAVDRADIVCTTLDAFVDENQLDAAKIKMIKIDVEGHETSVISGGVETLSKNTIPLLCEVLSDKSGADLISTLESLGYTRFEVFRRDVRNMFSTRVRREPFDLKNGGKAALVLAR